jgi:hypothetical protein
MPRHPSSCPLINLRLTSARVSCRLLCHLSIERAASTDALRAAYRLVSFSNIGLWTRAYGSLERAMKRESESESY